MIKTVIIDDEKSARDVLANILNEHFDAIEVVGQADDVDSGVKVIQECEPQLVFLDIKMPGGTGFDLLEQFPEKDFEVVFITAYDNFTMKAFQFSAIDYLLKPIKIKDLRETVGRLEKYLMKDKEKRLKVLIENYGAGEGKIKKNQYDLIRLATSSASRTLILSSFLSNFSLDHNGQLNFNANATYSVSLVCGFNKSFASCKRSSNSLEGMTLIFFPNKANNSLKASSDNLVFSSNSSSCLLSSVKSISGAIGSTCSENNKSTVLPSASKAEQSTFVLKNHFVIFGTPKTGSF